ncbi:MAG TPA: hypothetical protein VNW06_12740 [Cytophagaceae bacterium]|jgi:hypothetical protein|nr:hypothetical protein [Cytophagaceae bacterium]
MKKDYKEKLKVYSALAGGILLASANESEAQVVYHDISPDTVVNATNPAYTLDLNNDGNIDFSLSRLISGSTVSFYTNYTNATSNGQAIATQVSGVSFDAKLSLNDTVNSSKNYSYWALGKDASGVTTGAWVGGETDKYLGVRFKDVNGIYYYGWVRLSLAADFSVLTIKDYAYESSPGALIKAGAMSSVPAVTLVTGVDGGNAHNASDLSIGFAKASSETNIAHYRVFVAPTNPPQGTLGFNLDTAQMTAASNLSSYYDIAKTGSNIAKSLPASLSDIYGNAIVEGTPYTLYVVSVGNAGYDDALAVSASSVTLEPSVAGATAVVASDIANNGNASDMKVMFTKASSETNVNSYAVLVVPSILSGSANLTTAQAAVASGNYTMVAKTGANLSVILSPTAKDATGAAIVQGTSYEVFVLTIANVASSLGDSLSAGSAAVTLANTTAITDAQSIKTGISSYESTINLQNMPSEGSISVLSTTGAQVYTGAVLAGDNTYSLSYVKTGIYIVNLVFQNQVISKQVYISGK